MYDFENYVSLDIEKFKEKLAEIDSEDLIKYLKSCNDKKIIKEYYKRTKIIIGKNYLKLLKMAVNYKEKHHEK